MNQTQNYKLNQWEKSDRVLMEDFNADNAKIDAALKANANAISAETSARTALAAELRPKAGAQLIASYTLPSQLPSAYTFPSNIDWDSWLAVFITVELVLPNGSFGDLNFYINDIRGGELFLNRVNTPVEDQTAETFMLTPCFDKRNWVRVWPLTAYSFEARSRLNLRFKDITRFKISSGGALAAGTSYKIWGVR